MRTAAPSVFVIEAWVSLFAFSSHLAATHQALLSGPDRYDLGSRLIMTQELAAALKIAHEHTADHEAVQRLKRLVGGTLDVPDGVDMNDAITTFFVEAMTTASTTGFDPVHGLDSTTLSRLVELTRTLGPTSNFNQCVRYVEMLDKAGRVLCCVSNLQALRKQP